jgi:hypothetical protein
MVATLTMAVDPGRALLVKPVGLAVGGVQVDGERPGSRPGARLPRSVEGFAGDLVELAGRSPGERAQEGTQRGRRGDPVAEDLAGGASTQPVGVVDPLPPARAEWTRVMALSPTLAAPGVSPKYRRGKQISMCGLVAYRPGAGQGEPPAAWMGFDLLEGATTQQRSSACWTAWATSSATSR